MISAPANAASTNSDPATIAHTADRFVAHHMNLDASKAQTPAATITKTAVSIASLKPLLSQLNASRRTSLRESHSHKMCEELLFERGLTKDRERAVC